MVNVATICLAYRGKVEGVRLLAEYLADSGNVLFVHVDAKSDETPYREALEDCPQTRLLPARHAIYWGGFNTVRAIVDGLRFARDTARFDKFLVLTEDTIPVVSRTAFAELMTADTEFLDTRRATSAEVAERYRRFFYFDSYATTPRPCRTVQRAIEPAFLDDMSRLAALRDQGKVEVDALFHGSVWGGLSARAVDVILSTFDDNRRLRESFEFSAIPEEQYFHTILGDLPKTRPLVFADWSRQPTPYIFRGPDEIRSIDTQGAPFLRKVPLGDEAIEAYVRSLG